MANASGLVDELGGRWPGTVTILDTTFANGIDGFGQLTDSYNPVGMLNYEPSYPGGFGGGALVLCTGNQSDGGLSTNPMGECSAYRRMTRFMAETDESLKLSIEVWWAWQARYGKTRFRAFEFGFDQAYADGTRLYPSFRWLNCDDASDATRDGRWYVQTGNDSSPAYTLLPGPDSSGEAGWETPTTDFQTKLPFNENKRNIVYTRGIVQFNADKTVVYDGLKVNHRGIGSLAATPDTSLQALGPTSTTLADFAQGLNVAMSVRNRTNASLTGARVYVPRVRVQVMSI